jgi:putative ABC transport system permease protein
VLLNLRWSWRDLRARWLQVAAIALVIGIGSGVYSGLSSTSQWRLASYDASYERLGMWDLRVELAEGTAVDAAALAAAVDGVDDVEGTELRLVVPTQVDASTPDQTILVPGQVVGIDVTDDGPEIGRVVAAEGRPLVGDDAGTDVALLDQHFAEHYDLPVNGQIRVAPGVDLDYVGFGLSPEHLIIIPPRGTIFGEAAYAVLWAPLDTVQRISGQQGQANDLVIRARDGADRDMLEAAVTTALSERFPATGFTITPRDDDSVLRTLYDDIDSDQRFNNIFAVLILAGAAFAAFNLTGRIVQAQRREIGIGMALWVTPARLAMRPLLVGAQIATLGVVFGIAVGLVIDALLASVLSDVFPLPVWIVDFQPMVFLRGAALGFLLPLLATLFPVLRAVRVAPVEAIRTGHHVTSGSGLAPLLTRLPLPGSSVAQMPFRNVLRSPRRTLVTALGIAASITTLVGVIGMIDSYLATLDRGEAEVLGDQPDRLTISLEPAPVESDEVQAVLGSDVLEQAEAGLDLGGVLDPDDQAIEVFVSVVDLRSELWAPTLVEGSIDDVAGPSIDGAPRDRAGAASGEPPALVVSRKALDDLGLSVGDTVSLRHPVREGLGFRLVDSDVRVGAVHPNPFRFVSYLDIDHAGLFDLEGITNRVQAIPTAEVGAEGAQRELFGQPGVIAVQPVRTQVDAIRDRIEEFVSIFTIVQVAVLVLALLIAFNSTSINVDERRREHATMFAYGLPVRSVVRVAVLESVVTGLIGTVMGIIAGRILVSWITRVLFGDTVPDIGIIPDVALQTIFTALALGIVAVAVAPLLTIRRLRKMDIPSTLRVME